MANGRDLISKKTRTEFREFLVGSTLREIENEFSSAGLVPDRGFDPQLGSQRREFVEQYYHNVDFTNPSDVDKVLRVYEAILGECESNLANPSAYGDPVVLKREYDRLIGCVRRDGYDFVDGKLRPKGDTVAMRHLAATAQQLDAEYLAAQVDRLSEAVEQHPDLAIGQAKELVETCCKTILSELGEPGVDRLELVPLVKRTMAHLHLMPDDVSDAAKGAKTIKAILGNLAMISQGMAELRNLYGTGHGKHASHRQLPVRHARLAVGAATTLASFLFETYADRQCSANSHGPDGA